MRAVRAWSLQEREPEQILSQSYDLSVRYLAFLSAIIKEKLRKLPPFSSL